MFQIPRKLEIWHFTAVCSVCICLFFHPYIKKNSSRSVGKYYIVGLFHSEF